MHDLGRLVARGIKGKEPLPAPFKDWAKRGMLIYPGSVTLIAGLAGVHKSMLVANAVINMGQKTLFFSNDTDELTVAARLLGIATRQPTEYWRHRAVQYPREAAQHLERFRNIKWAFSPDPTLDDVWLHTYAWAEMHGEWPKVIVLDIASNVYVEGTDEWAALRELMRQANVLARTTGAAVIVVHHCAEGTKVTESEPCPSRSSVMGKISALPVLMVTLGKNSEENVVWAACVKARNAPCDPTGRTSFRMAVDPASSLVEDYDPSRHFRAYANVATGVYGGGWEPQQ